MLSLPRTLPSPREGRGVAEALAASRWYPLGPAAPGSARDRQHRLAAFRLVHVGATRLRQRKDRAHPGGCPERLCRRAAFIGTSRGEAGRRGSWEPSRRELCAIILTQNARPRAERSPHGEGEASIGGA